MNPRHRRLLIPGLLVALVVVVVVSSIAHRAEGAEKVDPPARAVSTIDDPRLGEASGMAVSRAHDDLVYVVNDSGNAPEVFAVRVSTGDVVGVTTVQGVTWRDTEAMAIAADGTLWVADTGDNLRRRDDVALYALHEPGPGDHVVSATRYPVSFPDGPEDVEALLLDPRDERFTLVSKGLVAGEFYRLPTTLEASTPNRAERVDGRAPGVVTDGAFTADGKHVLLRTYGTVQEYSSGDLASERVLAVPAQQQGETLAIERGDRSFLIGSEGSPSPLVRVAVPPATTPSASPSTAATPSPASADDPTEGATDRTAWWVGGAIAAAVASALLVAGLRRR